MEHRIRIADLSELKKRGWAKKFRDAFRGVGLGVRGQSSFAVHLIMAGAVVAAGVVLRVQLAEWCVLGLCVAMVLTAEMFNSALEHLGKAIDQSHNQHLADGLDIASAAVLVASIGAATVGAAVFVYRFGVILQWWR